MHPIIPMLRPSFTAIGLCGLCPLHSRSLYHMYCWQMHNIFSGMLVMGATAKSLSDDSTRKQISSSHQTSGDHVQPVCGISAEHNLLTCSCPRLGCISWLWGWMT